MNTNKLTCNFAIVHFLPYPETEEFVNVGVVLACPARHFFGFRLETQRRDRVTRFFPEMKSNVFTEGRNHFRDELERVREYLNQSEQGTPLPFVQSEFNSAFRDVIKPRESLFRFSSARTRLADDPEEALEHLFDYYVDRLFAQRPEYQETEMVKRLTKTLRAAKIIGYREDKIGNEMYEVHFPLMRKSATTERSFRAIKPLDLAKDRPTAVTEHGDSWLAKLGHLKEMDYDPSQVLFAVQMPHDRKRIIDAAKAITDKIKHEGARVVEIAETDSIKRFADSN